MQAKSQTRSAVTGIANQWKLLRRRIGKSLVHGGISLGYFIGLQPHPVCDAPCDIGPKLNCATNRWLASIKRDNIPRQQAESRLRQLFLPSTAIQLSVTVPEVARPKRIEELPERQEAARSREEVHELFSKTAMTRCHSSFRFR